MIRTNPVRVVAYAVAGVCCLFKVPDAQALTINGLTFSVNSSEIGDFFWTSPSTSGWAEVGGGYVYLSPGNTGEENKRGMSEFDLTGLLPASAATLSFDIASAWGYFIQGANVTANVYTYQGNNLGELADFNAATTGLLGVVRVNEYDPFTCPDPDLLPPDNYCEGDTVSFDVTTIVNNAILSGWSSLGILLQANFVSPSNASRFDNFQLNVSYVPLPGAFWLFVSGVFALGAAGSSRTRS